MNINAKYFGTVSYDKEDLIFLPDGLFGFESCKNFLPIPLHKSDDSFISLQSTDDETLSFILMNPFTFFPDYSPVLSEKDKKDLKIESEEEVSYYVICVLNDSLNSSTVNLKAPLAVNTKSRVGKQIILDSPSYGFKHAIPYDSKRKE